MREILFRGKRIDNGEWVYGTPIYPKGYDKVIITTGELAVPNVPDFGFVQYEVIPETVCRRTSLSDKNGKQIWEGDIVLFLGNSCEVVSEIGAFGIVNEDGFDYENIESELKQEAYCFNNYNGCYNDNFISLWEIYWNFNNEENSIDELEVIGNIHDKEEL